MSSHASHASPHVTLSPGCLIDDRGGPGPDAQRIPKVGGRALLPPSRTCRAADGALQMTCPGCSDEMSFIASVRKISPPSPVLLCSLTVPATCPSPPIQTPTIATHGRERESIVYIFGCLREGCGGSRGSWRAFRWTQGDDATSAVEEQLDGRAGDAPRATNLTNLTNLTSLTNADDANSTPQDPPTSSVCTASWGLDDDEDLGDACDLGDLSEQLKSLMANPSNDTRAPMQHPARSKAPKEAARAGNQAKRKQTASPVEAFEGRIPAFYLVHSANIPPAIDIDSEDEEDARYGQGPSAGNARAEEQKTSASQDGAEDEWVGEAYERDAVIRTGTQRNTSSSLENEAAFVAYMRELSRVPDQCLRVYGGGAGVPYAWPTKHPDVSSSCPRCGHPRRCAVQVMSPLIVAMAEGLEMAQEHAASPALCGPPTSWDWATLAVSICAQSCVDGDGGGEQQHGGGERQHGGGERQHGGGERQHGGGEQQHGGGEQQHGGDACGLIEEDVRVLGEA